MHFRRTTTMPRRMDRVTLLIAAKASPNEARRLAHALDAVHPLVEVDTHVEPGAALAEIELLCLWTPWKQPTEQRPERAMKACIGWVGSRASRVRRTHRLVVFGAGDRVLHSVDIVWPSRQIVDAPTEGVPGRPD